MSLVDGIPSRMLLLPPRLAMAESQKRLATAQVEAATGRHDDIGLSLGVRTGFDIGLRLHLSALEKGLDGARQAALRADTLQNALSSINGLVERFRSTITGARTAESGRSLSASFARTALDTLHDTLSVTYDGQYLFGGLATDISPLNAYADGPRQAVLDAFQTEFGFAPTDPATEGISATQLDAFLDGAFSNLFSATGWSGTWSNAADAVPRFRLPSGDSLGLSTSANEAFSRTLTQAFTMIEVLGGSKISAATFQNVTDRALALVSEAQLKSTDEQARIGIGQDRLKAAQTALEQSKSTTTSAISALEDVDPYEAATRVNLLMTQLEGAYALTGRISKMSLLSYI